MKKTFCGTSNSRPAYRFCFGSSLDQASGEHNHAYRFCLATNIHPAAECSRVFNAAAGALMVHLPTSTLRPQQKPFRPVWPHIHAHACNYLSRMKILHACTCHHHQRVKISHACTCIIRSHPPILLKFEFEFWKREPNSLLVFWRHFQYCRALWFLAPWTTLRTTTHNRLFSTSLYYSQSLHVMALHTSDQFCSIPTGHSALFRKKGASSRRDLDADAQGTHNLKRLRHF